MLPLTLQFLIAMIACAINERQQRVLEYKTEEVLVLKAILKAVTGKERSISPKASADAWPSLAKSSPPKSEKNSVSS